MEGWIIGVLLALFVIVPCWLALARRQELERQVNAWPELARRTGLTFGPGYSASGEYRGRWISLSFFCFGEDRALMNQIAAISINVENRARISLCIRAKSALEYIRMNSEISSGHSGFDARFHATGSPREYVQRAVDRIVRCDPPLLAWILRSYPSIELKGGAFEL